MPRMHWLVTSCAFAVSLGLCVPAASAQAAAQPALTAASSSVAAAKKPAKPGKPVPPGHAKAKDKTKGKAKGKQKQHPQPTGRDKGSRFTLGVLPDTQFYSRYATAGAGELFNETYGSEPYLAQTRWLAENADRLNMEFVTHLGDVVDQSMVEEQWGVADEAMKVLEEADLDYSILPGNHDLNAPGNSSTFQKWFPESRNRLNETYLEGHQGSEAHIFEAEGQRYLVLALTWRGDAGGEAGTLAWAQGVLDAHPNLPTILTTHETLDVDAAGDGVHMSPYGQYLWDNLVTKNNQIFVTIGGHHHGAGHRVDTNASGQPVVQILQDYQMAYAGGNGLLGVLEFDLTGNQLEMTALSPWVAEKPQEVLNQFDDVLLQGAPDSYAIDFNFADRFKTIDPAWRVGRGKEKDLSALARALITRGYEEPTIDPAELPTGADDYAQVEATEAHWRPGQLKATEGQVLPVGTAIPEIIGQQSFIRRPGAGNWAEDDVVWSADHHPQSSDAGSVCFRDSARDPQVTNYFTTADGVEVNAETFPDGYTVEAFLKVDKKWTAEQNRWMGLLTRTTDREDLGYPISEGDEPIATLAFSSLAELQWAHVSTSGVATDGASAWSHEVPTDEWVHVAIVNDVKKRTATMYLNGSPILRTVIDSAGLASSDDPWLLGAAWWDQTAENGWLGCVGEVRMAHGALTPDQWLTARR